MRRLSALPSGTRARLPLLFAFAALVRVLAFVGRGDYVAYDEAWYLLLGRNLVEGSGYTLAGLRHVALSPLFPLVAGMLDALIGDAVLAGRIVAGLAGALLVVPCWFLFRRFAGERTATIGCAIVAALPALAPYAAPRWVGWELWVGAEPLFHLLLFTGLACFARALDQPHRLPAVAAGAALALAYLTRAEGILVFALLAGFGVLAAALRRSARGFASVALMALAFGVVSAPYWLYLHDALGRWAITGRGVQVSASVGRAEGERPAGAARVIERMLWQRDYTYAEALYALHPSGTRMASDYWGIPTPGDDAAVGAPAAPVAEPQEREATPTNEAAAPPAASADASGRARLYARALAILVPIYLWPLVLLGLVRRLRRMGGSEAAILAALAGVSVAIAIVVAVDPRTQLLILPLLCFYAAAGLASLEGFAARLPKVRPRVIVDALLVMLLVAMLAETARRSWLGATLATEVQVMGTEFRLLGQGLRAFVPPDDRIVSWHPAVAVHARRDWRPLPLATAPDVVRYARASGASYVVFGGHNPSALRPADLPREYLVLVLDSQTDRNAPVEIVAVTPLFAVGRLEQP